jgi:eukaryotic-like serine/threonine-protein kinase
MAAADFQPGAVLNDTWRLERVLGEGGIGRVFEATDLKLGRKVAVKTLLTEHLTEETVKRFEREAQVMAQVDHPNIVSLYGFRRHQGTPYLVMRYLDGRSLATLRKETGGRVSLAAILPLASQLLEALGHLHQKGLVHRDIKPSNIFVSPAGKVTLLDLGLTRGTQTSLTRTGMVWGTPSFMAPEQILAERTLDGRVDLYAVAGVLYRLLTGKLPFPTQGDESVLQAHLTRPRPDACALAPELPVAVGQVLMRAMAIAPEQRYQTAAEMAAALTAAAATAPPPVASGKPADDDGRTEPARPSALTEKTLPARKKLLLVAGGAAALLALGIGLGLWLARAH